MIVGLSGLAGSGKSTVASLLASRHGFKVVSFARPLKDMLAVLGLTDSQLYGDEKETVDPRFGCTPRHMMQTLGTEWGRDLISPLIWTDAWMREVAFQHTYRRLPVVADDVRFPNEVAAVNAAGGRMIHVMRSGASTNTSHPSERQDLFGASHSEVIFNDGSKEDLHASIARVLGLEI